MKSIWSPGWQPNSPIDQEGIIFMKKPMLTVEQLIAHMKEK